MTKPKIETRLDSEAERDAFAEVARQHGMSSAEMIRRYVRDVVREAWARQAAQRVASLREEFGLAGLGPGADAVAEARDEYERVEPGPESRR